MDVPIHIDTISMGLFILYFKFLNYDVFLSLKIDLILANSANPDKISSGSSMFAKVPVLGFPVNKGLKTLC